MAAIHVRMRLSTIVTCCRWLVVAGASLLLFGGAAVAQPNYGGTLRVGLSYDLVHLDPHKQTVRQITELVYDTLVEIEPNGAVVPALAKAWSVSDDGRRWTFTLRDDVVFHDDHSFDAHDVVASIARIRDPSTASPRASDFDAVDRVSAIDEHTVLFELSEPFGPLLSTLAFSVHAIVPAHAIDATSMEDGLVGTGPFRFAAYEPSSRLVLDRVPNHWRRDNLGNRLPYLDRVHVHIMPDDPTRIAALVYGSIDFINLVPSAYVAPLRENGEIVVAGGPSSNQRGLLFNLTRPPLDDRRVRKAIAHAIDEEQIVESALFGEASVALGTGIPAFTPYGIDTNPYVGKHVEAAIELLAEAGFEDGFDLVLHTTSAIDFFRAPAEVIQANLADVGIRVEIVVEDFSLWLARTRDSDFSAILTGVPNEVDPDANLYAYFHSEGTLNLSMISDPELDALLDAGRQAIGFDERFELYRRAQEVMLREAYFVPLFHNAVYEAMRPEVRGYRHYVHQAYLGLVGVWLDEQ